MANRILRHGSSIFKKSPAIKQKFDYLLVLDFEATCDQGASLKPQEIIEFPCLALSTKSWTVENEFHRYIRPRVHPNLTTFCTRLTGILQDTMDQSPRFPRVLQQFSDWLDEGRYFGAENKSAFVTCGNWDLRVMLPEQCALENLAVPEHFKEWIDLKAAYCECTYYFPRSLKDMLLRLELPLLGQLHSGIDDTRNMVQILCTLNKKHNFNWKITSTEDVGFVSQPKESPGGK